MEKRTHRLFLATRLPLEWWEGHKTGRGLAGSLQKKEAANLTSLNHPFSAAGRSPRVFPQSRAHPRDKQTRRSAATATQVRGNRRGASENIPAGPGERDGEPALALIPLFHCSGSTVLDSRT